MTFSSQKLMAMVFAGGIALGVASAALLAEDQSVSAGGKEAAAAVNRAASKPTSRPATTRAAKLNKMCPVMTDDEVDPAYTYIYKGRTIGFCCDDCIDDFKKDPEKYMKNLK